MHDAETLAAAMLEWLSRDAGRLARFCDLSGYTPEDMMRDVGSRPLLMAVLEYLMQDEPLLLQFCADTGASPRDCALIWQRLRQGGG